MKDLFGNLPGQIEHRPVSRPDTKPSPELPPNCPQEVADLFERIALQLWHDGRRHFSADAILHRIRWYHRVEQKNDSFKCNDHWTSGLARWLIAKHPHMDGFFELRKSPGE